MINADYEPLDSVPSYRLSPQGLPALAEPSRLDSYLLKIYESIALDGLKSLYWVTGIHTKKIASGLLNAVEHDSRPKKPSAKSHCIVVRPGEIQVIEPFGSRFGFSIRRMEEVYDDSFLIVNRAILLDVTPVAADDGTPEFNDDSTVVSLYIGLFNMLKNRSAVV